MTEEIQNYIDNNESINEENTNKKQMEILKKDVILERKSKYTTKNDNDNKYRDKDTNRNQEKKILPNEDLFIANERKRFKRFQEDSLKNSSHKDNKPEIPPQIDLFKYVLTNRTKKNNDNDNDNDNNNNNHHHYHNDTSKQQHEDDGKIDLLTLARNRSQFSNNYNNNNYYNNNNNNNIRRNDNLRNNYNNNNYNNRDIRFRNNTNNYDDVNDRYRRNSVFGNRNNYNNNYNNNNMNRYRK